jgi:hypothetical protein
MSVGWGTAQAAALGDQGSFLTHLPICDIGTIFNFTSPQRVQKSPG